jgi:CheY-like chemotaxis protein
MTSDSRHRETILLAEDDAPLRYLVARILRGGGYTVIEAVDGEDALARSAGHERIDLLVTDMVMPKLGGVELARRLFVSNPEMRVMYMSGYPDAGLGKGSEFEPETSRIAKPFAARELLQEVRNLLDMPRTSPARM